MSPALAPEAAEFKRSDQNVAQPPPPDDSDEKQTRGEQALTGAEADAQLRLVAGWVECLDGYIKIACALSILSAFCLVVHSFLLPRFVPGPRPSSHKSRLVYNIDPIAPSYIPAEHRARNGLLAWCTGLFSVACFFALIYRRALRVPAIHPSRDAHARAPSFPRPSLPLGGRRDANGEADSGPCPCGAAHRTLDHIVAHCPLLEPHRHLLRDVSPSLSVDEIQSSTDGVRALVRFCTAAASATGPRIPAGGSPD